MEEQPPHQAENLWPSIPCPAAGSSLRCPLLEARISQKNQCLTRQLQWEHGPGRQHLDKDLGLCKQPAGVKVLQIRGHLLDSVWGHLAAQAKGKWRRILWGSSRTLVFLGSPGI